MNEQTKTDNLYLSANQWDKFSPLSILKYAVGGLLYAPATHGGIGESIYKKRYPLLKSLALCLEDAILDDHVEAAESQLLATIQELDVALNRGEITLQELPLLFIRVRSSNQLKRVFAKLADYLELISGFVLPKFSVENGKEYQQTWETLKGKTRQQLYLMPIIESQQVINLATRHEELFGIQRILAELKGDILNVRVGGNDFCKIYGFRRRCDQTIYEIGVVNSVLTDIQNVFGQDYVISGPVWEYFDDGKNSNWAKGLAAEIALDKLNGFIGKTAIHPSQIFYVQDALIVDYEDYMDANAVLHWNNETNAVDKSLVSHRMNEVKVHRQWAEKTMALANVYGVRAGGGIS